MSDYLSKDHEKRLLASQQYWDNQAATFDDDPDHGLRDPSILDTWTELLRKWLPSTPASVLEPGCGTGSLSVILAELGHVVTGIDVSPAMIALAQEKAVKNGYQIALHVMDAAFPQLPGQKFDVILCRHLLWALPEPEQVILRWIAYLKPMGRMILIEGHWGTGAGLHVQEIMEMLPDSLVDISVQNLSDNPNYWGRSVTDERYAILAELR